MVRASCAKAIGAVALKNPDEVDDFPQYCIDAMVKAATEIPDPITKLAVMSGLSQVPSRSWAESCTLPVHALQHRVSLPCYLCVRWARSGGRDDEGAGSFDEMVCMTVSVNGSRWCEHEI